MKIEPNETKRRHAARSFVVETGRLLEFLIGLVTGCHPRNRRDRGKSQETCRHA